VTDHCLRPDRVHVVRPASGCGPPTPSRASTPATGGRWRSAETSPSEQAAMKCITFAARVPAEGQLIMNRHLHRW